MKQDFKKQVLKEAIRIGDKLISVGQRDKNGLSWKTLSIVKAKDKTESSVISIQQESIYMGVAGIVLFFLELYKITQEDKYLNTAIDGMKWVEDYCQKNPTNNYAFYTGRMGVSFAFLRLYNVTGNNHYLEEAKKIARPCTNLLKHEESVADLINGISGTLLGLLHLHSKTQEAWILETIDIFVTQLIHHVHHSWNGLYWDRNSMQIDGLCGFSHGAAGVGYVFLELAHYFQNDAFCWMAEQAFSYESNYYDEFNKNWKDLRKGIWNSEDYEEHREAYLSEDIGFFTQWRDMNAWCHGAAGIGLSRMRAIKMLNNLVYKNEVKTAIEKTILTSLDSNYFGLCHGAGGNAELFIEAYKAFGEEKYLSHAEKIALNVLNYQKGNSPYITGYPDKSTLEDNSLFNGIAGIGYFLLRVYDPMKINNILMPNIDITIFDKKLLNKHPNITISKQTLRKEVLNRIFKRTLFLTEKIFPNELKVFFQNKISDTKFSDKERFIQFVNDTIALSVQENKNRILDVFKLELEQIRMDEAIRSNALLFIKNDVIINKAGDLVKFNIDQFLKLNLILDSDSKLYQTRWDWDKDSPDKWGNNIEIKFDIFHVLLRKTPLGITENNLSLFTHSVLAAFANVTCVKNGVKTIATNFEYESIEDKKAIENAVIEQIKQALLTGILVEAQG